MRKNVSHILIMLCIGVISIQASDKWRQYITHGNIGNINNSIPGGQYTFHTSEYQKQSLQNWQDARNHLSYSNSFVNCHEIVPRQSTGINKKRKNLGKQRCYPRRSIDTAFSCGPDLIIYDSPTTQQNDPNDFGQGTTLYSNSNKNLCTFLSPIHHMRQFLDMCLNVNNLYVPYNDFIIPAAIVCHQNNNMAYQLPDFRVLNNDLNVIADSVQRGCSDWSHAKRLSHIVLAIWNTSQCFHENIDAFIFIKNVINKTDMCPLDVVYRILFNKAYSGYIPYTLLLQAFDQTLLETGLTAYQRQVLSHALYYNPANMYIDVNTIPHCSQLCSESDVHNQIGIGNNTQMLQMRVDDNELLSYPNN